MPMSTPLPQSHIPRYWEGRVLPASRSRLNRNIVSGHRLLKDTFFLYSFQHLVKVKRHIFDHKYSPRMKQCMDWHWGPQYPPLLPVIKLMLCLLSS